MVIYVCVYVCCVSMHTLCVCMHAHVCVLCVCVCVRVCVRVCAYGFVYVCIVSSEFTDLQ